ncbi:MAG: acetolactate synthase large subunit [Candidatus Sulfobium sp.]|jgi:acetolactate synthase-1/2/3 large subunit
MNGAEMIMRTARKAGIEVCFSNFGTTETPLALAFDTEPGVKPVLGLFEGVCTGAADGYGRMMDKPAMTLLHLGPGLANGVAYLHNAKRAKTPLLNLVGEHTMEHIPLDAPLAMNIEALAGTISGWYKTSRSSRELSRDLADAFEASLYGQISTLIIPNDYQQAEIADDKVAIPGFEFERIETGSIEKAVQIMTKNRKVALIIGGRALRKRGLEAAARIRALKGCDLLTDYLPGYMERGVGLPEITRIPYFPEPAIELLSGYEAVVICGTREPVGFFGYKGIRGRLLSEDQPRVLIDSGKQNTIEALECLADALGCSRNITPETTAARNYPSLARGELTAEKACQTLAAVQPEGAIIVDEGVSSAFPYYSLSCGLLPHTMMTIAGGAIGHGMPCSTGAAVACPDRPVINLEADGSAMYTVQALWTQARQGLNITTLICSNRRYNILKLELERAGIKTPGPNVSSLIDIENPHINWTEMALAMGVPAVSVNTGDQLAEEIRRALAEPGPHLIEMLLA